VVAKARRTGGQHKKCEHQPSQHKSSDGSDHSGIHPPTARGCAKTRSLSSPHDCDWGRPVARRAKHPVWGIEEPEFY
jgi:hypothetical protein